MQQSHPRVAAFPPQQPVHCILPLTYNFSVPQMLSTSLSFHKRYLLQTMLLVSSQLVHALSPIPALLQIQHLLEHLLLDSVQAPGSNSWEDIILDQSVYARIYLYTIKIHQSGNFQYVQLFHYIVVVPQQTCYLS